MKLQQWMTIILISFSCMLMTACKNDDNDNNKNYQAMVIDTHWQLSSTYVNNKWQTTAEFTDLNIKDLWFCGKKDYQINIFNFDGNKRDNTFQGNYELDNNTFYFYTGPYAGPLFSISINSMGENTLEGDFTIWKGITAVYDKDGNESFEQDTETYTVRMTRK